ncbi:MAG: AAA family ATPase, partial [Gammaproteobacteria bacterium]|nr:AAA family ATPase [Gammaproteobacteria bacterium]
MRGLFVTGTDTGVGKTRVAAAMIRALGCGGLKTVGMKPVASGSASSARGLRNEDALL